MSRVRGSARANAQRWVGCLLSGMAVTVLLLAVPASGQQPPVKFGIVTEVTGGLSGPGTYLRDGSLQAVDEINAKGGILGRKIETGVFDTQSDPPTSVGVMRRALNENPFVILGPTYSSNTVANMHLPQQAGVPQITGSEASIITQKGNPNVFRVALTQVISFAKTVKYLAEDLKADKVGVIWANDAWGKGGWDALNSEWQARGKSFVVAIPTEFQQVDFTAELTQLKNSGAKTLFLYQHEEEAARVLAQIHKMGLQFDNVVGDSSLCNEQTIMLAKNDVEGVKCHEGLIADAPIAGMREMADRFYARTKHLADANAIKGYISPYMVKAVVEATGSFDQEKFRSCLHGMYLEVAKEPGLLLDAYVDNNGDLDRESFLAEVKGGKPVVVKVLPMLRTGYPKKACK